MGLSANAREPCPGRGAVKTHRALGEACRVCGVEGHARPLTLSEVVARKRAALHRAEVAHMGRPRLVVAEEAL